MSTEPAVAPTPEGPGDGGPDKPEWKLSRTLLLAILLLAVLLVAMERVYLRGIITGTVAWEVYVWLVTVAGLGLGGWRLWVERRR